MTSQTNALPSIETLTDNTPATYRHYVTNAAAVAVVWFNGDHNQLYTRAHVSYEGFRVVALLVTDQDGESDLLCYFDHEDSNIYTFAGRVDVNA